MAFKRSSSDVGKLFYSLSVYNFVLPRFASIDWFTLRPKKVYFLSESFTFIKSEWSRRIFDIFYFYISVFNYFSILLWFKDDLAWLIIFFCINALINVNYFLFPS